MDPIETLMNEHRRIEAALNALDAYAARLSEGGAAPLDDLAEFVRFIREFADRTHHGKEEDILFEVMVREGFPKDGGPIAVMLMEHDEGRDFVKVLADAVEAGGEPDQTVRAQLQSASRGYTSLLRAHIQKEDQILYVMAKERLGPAAYDEVSRRCAAYDAEHAGEKAELVALGESLAAKYS